MLTVSGLAKAHGSRTLFSDVTFRLSPGRRIALIGGNGVGKSTILEIIVGLQHADSGEVSQPKDFKVGYLPQELIESWSGTVLEEVMRGAGEIQAIEQELAEVTARMADAEAADHARTVERFGQLQDRFETLGGYQLESEARRILAGLGFTETDMDAPLGEMSGGWQMRAALARLLLQNPDCLLLDEPTNHLDVDSVAWLEDQLRNWPGAILFVSHDRDFIDAVAERVVEVAWGTTMEYVGGFAEFVVAREEKLASLEAAAARQVKEIERVERFIERFRYKATKSRQVQSRIKTLEKLERIQVPKVDELRLAFGFPEPRRSSRLVVEIEDVTVGYDGEPVLTGVDLVVERGQQVALVGPNGAGKSTLLKLILGQLEPMSGTAKLGANVDVAYFAQHQVDALDLSKTVEQEFRHKVGEQPKNRNMRTVLGSFGFSGDAVDRLVGDLSGGERTRLALAEIMCDPVNLLVLDEPTNHLDLPSCDVLEDALRVYPGTVLIVSHDRHLIRNCAEQLVEVRDGVVTHYSEVDERLLSPGSDTDERVESMPVAKKSPLAKSTNSANNSATNKASKQSNSGSKNGSSNGAGAAEVRKLRKEVNRLERKSTEADTRKSELEALLADPEVYQDQARMNELVGEYEAVQQKADRLVNEWEAALARLESAS